MKYVREGRMGVSMKYVREGRMGLTKCFKTGAVVGTYPKPLLVMLFDEAGLEIIPSRSTAATQPADLIKLDCVWEDIKFIRPEELPQYLAKPESELPKVVAIDFCDKQVKPVTFEFGSKGDSAAFQAFFNASEHLYNQAVKVTTATANGQPPPPWPFRTLVVDSFSGFQDAVFSHMAAFNPNALKDARVWSSSLGEKVRQLVSSYTTFPCHVVFIMHTQTDKNDLTGEIREEPAIYSKQRSKIGSLLSQVFYATKQGTKPILYTSDSGFVKGLGARWPVGLPNPCAPDYTSIYGKEVAK